MDVVWQVLWNSTAEKAYGKENGMLGGLMVKNVKTGDLKEVPVSGLFFAIGHEPASKFLNGQARALLCSPFSLPALALERKTALSYMPFGLGAQQIIIQWASTHPLTRDGNQN